MELPLSELLIRVKNLESEQSRLNRIVLDMQKNIEELNRVIADIAPGATK